MKATVWTSWNVKISGDRGRPKCIFNGDIKFPPREDDYIVVRDGFGAERVQSVIHDFVNGDIEIAVQGCDPENAYGPCLRDKI